MIINTGQRTDIPAFYSDWFFQRIKEGYVYVRNPYDPKRITYYDLNKDVVDVICFCTKNPKPMLSRLDELKEFRQFWHVTITPYDRDIEPYVPLVKNVIKSFRELSLKVGWQAVVWRYDPIFINEKYTLDYHLNAFHYIAKHLSGYTNQCIISFIDLYKKTKKNCPSIKEVSIKEQEQFVKECVKIAKEYHIEVYTCLENKNLEKYEVHVQGCMTKNVLKKALNIDLNTKSHQIRNGCDCLLGNDIGAYNTCLHGCLYCYANENKQMVKKLYNQHDPFSPLLIGQVHDEDQIYKAKQQSNINRQLCLDIGDDNE